MKVFEFDTKHLSEKIADGKTIIRCYEKNEVDRLLSSFRQKLVFLVRTNFPLDEEEDMKVVSAIRLADLIVEFDKMFPEIKEEEVQE